MKLGQVYHSVKNNTSLARNMDNPFWRSLYHTNKMEGFSMNGKFLLGNNPDLSKADMGAIAQHFQAIMNILSKAGLDKAHIYEFIHGLIDNWWVDSCLHVASAILDTVSAFIGL